MTSLYAKLLKGIISFFLSLWLIVVILTRFEVSHEIEELFDAQLSQEAGIIFDSIIETVQHNQLNHKVLEKRLIGHEYENKISFQLWSKDGQNDELIFRSHNAPSVKLSDRLGYIDKELNEHKWRVYTTVKTIDNIKYTIISAEDYDIRNELINEILIQSIFPLILSLPVLIFLLHIAIKKGLTPLNEIALKLEKRKATDLSTVDTDNIPLEIKTLITSLNRLMYRLGDAFEKEKRFTTNAAHELRTPITGIQIQAQLAKEFKTNEQKLDQALDNILTGTNKSSYLINQMLTIARLDADSIKEKFVESSIILTVREAVLSWSDICLEKNIKLTFNAEPEQDFIVSHYPDGINLIVNNLLQNSLRYSPQNGIIIVKISKYADYLNLSVLDNGPGIDEEKLDKVLEKYYRDENQPSDGCGLGLAIVKEMVNIHEGSIELKNTLNTSPNNTFNKKNGLLVQIKFPIVNMIEG